MDISNLGADCYRRFDRRAVLNSLEGIKELKVLRQSKLSQEQACLAYNRALTRLSRYYEHMQGLLLSFPHDQVEAAIESLQIVRLDDEAKLLSIYNELCNRGGGLDEDDYPGLALFLQVDNRSVALLPEAEPVYMASAWKRAVNESTIDFSRILRSNRLWQRERWWVSPISDDMDTAEPFAQVGSVGETSRTSAPQNKYFNNIASHQKGIDGWVDAFWGVQSGLRLAIPVEGVENTWLVILLTTFLPDAFKAWNHDDYYVKEIPAEVARQATRCLSEKFREEIFGLAFAASTLKDVTASETSVMGAAMRMLAHYATSQDSRSRSDEWETRVFNLVDRLLHVSPKHYKVCREIEIPKAYIINRLEGVASSLPVSEQSSRWKVDLEDLKVNRARFSFLPRECTVGSLHDALKSLEKDMESTVFLKASRQQLAIGIDGIDSYLLTAIAENLVSHHNAHLAISVSMGLTRSFLEIVALYPRWSMKPEEEADFLLKPLNGSEGKTRVGFYLTAQVLWRSSGAVAYYRLGDGKNENPALIHLKLPLGGR